MIAYTTLLLFLIGLFSSIKVGVKVDKILSLVTFTSLFLVFLGFCDGMNSVREHVFSFSWNTTTGNSLKLEIISNSYNYLLVWPCFALTVLSALNALLFHYEKRSTYFSVLIFNLTALIVLITSNNFVQLLSALFVIDIISPFLIKNVEAYRRYVLLNLLADMILFMVLAVINCRVASLDIRQIILYRNVGMHKDFVALAGLTAVFAKFGFFLFQIGVMNLRKIRFHRMMNVLFLSSPLATLILLLKFSALWRTSAYFILYLDIVCICTIVWGALGSLFANNFKAKVIYWQMSFWALFVELLRFHGFIWFSGFTFLLLEMYLFACLMYLFYYYNHRQQLMLKIKNMPLINKRACAYTLLLLIATIAAMSNTLTILYNNMNRYYIWTFAILFILSLSAVIKQLFSKEKNKKIHIHDDIPVNGFIFVELTLLCTFLLQDWRYAEPSVWCGTALFSLLCVCNPLAKTEFLYNIKGIQNKDILGRLYYTLIKSFRLCGKFFWLLIDRLFMEKIVLSLLISFIHVLMHFFRKIHSSNIVGGVLGVVLLIIFLGYSYYRAEVGF